MYILPEIRPAVSGRLLPSLSPLGNPLDPMRHNNSNSQMWIRALETTRFVRILKGLPRRSASYVWNQCSYNRSIEFQGAQETIPEIPSTPNPTHTITHSVWPSKQFVYSSNTILVFLEQIPGTLKFVMLIEEHIQDKSKKRARRFTASSKCTTIVAKHRNVLNSPRQVFTDSVMISSRWQRNKPIKGIVRHAAKFCARTTNGRWSRNGATHITGSCQWWGSMGVTNRKW